MKGERIPWDELSDSDSDSETDDTEDQNPANDTELKQLSDSIKNTITCLFRLSMAIRDPAPNSQSRSFVTFDKSIFEPHDISHVQAKFPEADSWLIERLGRAISGRRQYLNYREEHHQKLARNVEKIGIEEPRTEHTTNSTEASPMPSSSGPRMTDALDDGEDTLSQTSYATSVNATIRAPSLPKEARTKEHFECPLCYMIVSIHTTAVWKQHVYRDLHPFCCTYEHCTTADRLYDSRRAWYTHELSHKISWQCIDGCDETFGSEEEFVAHIQKQHPDLARVNMIPALKRTAVKRADLTEQMKCPLCNKRMSLRAMQKHLGHHQEQLALFALPPNLDDTEEDVNDEGGVNVDVEKWQDEELSDLSDNDGVDKDLEALTITADNSPYKNTSTNNKFSTTVWYCCDCEIGGPYLSSLHMRCICDHRRCTGCPSEAVISGNDSPVGSDIQEKTTHLQTTPPLDTSIDTHSTVVPWGADPETILGKIAAIALHFHTEIAPRALEFIKSPPSNDVSRQREKRRLINEIRQETTQKLLGVNTEGNQEAKVRGLNLFIEAQQLLAELEEVMEVTTLLVCERCGSTFDRPQDLRTHQYEQQ